MTSRARPAPRKARKGQESREGQQGQQHRRGRERQRQPGREQRRCIAPGDDAEPGRHVDGLDEPVALHGQRRRRAVLGLPGGAPAGDVAHRADHAGAGAGEHRSRRRLGRRPAHAGYPRARRRAARKRLDAERRPGELVGEDRERAVETGEGPVRRGQDVSQLAVGHHDVSARLGHRGRPQRARPAERPRPAGSAGCAGAAATTATLATGPGNVMPSAEEVIARARNHCVVPSGVVSPS